MQLELGSHMEYIIASIIGLLFIVFVARMVQRRKKRIRRELDPRKIGIKDIDRMEDGSEFEIYLYHLFSKMGYEGVYKTTGSRDFGADLVFTDRNGVRVVVQAKRYAVQNPVGLGAVQEIYASMRYYQAEKSIVITSGRYTEACKTLAGVNGVKLLNREEVMGIIDLFKARRIEEAMDIIEGEPLVVTAGWKGSAGTGKRLSKRDQRAT